MNLLFGELHFQSIPNRIRYLSSLLLLLLRNLTFRFYLCFFLKKLFLFIVADSLLHICALCCFCCLLILPRVFVQQNFFRLQVMWLFILPLQLVKTKREVKWPGQGSAVNQCCILEWDQRGILMGLTIRPVMVSCGMRHCNQKCVPGSFVLLYFCFSSLPVSMSSFAFLVW